MLETCSKLCFYFIIEPNATVFSNGPFSFNFDGNAIFFLLFIERQWWFFQVGLDGSPGHHSVWMGGWVCNEAVQCNLSYYWYYHWHEDLLLSHTMLLLVVGGMEVYWCPMTLFLELSYLDEARLGWSVVLQVTYRSYFFMKIFHVPKISPRCVQLMFFFLFFSDLSNVKLAFWPLINC